MCRPRSSPIVVIIVAEFEATARPSIRVFQTFVRREDRAAWGAGERRGRLVAWMLLADALQA